MNNPMEHRSWILGTMTFGALTLALLFALLLIAARPAQAQTETVLYNFCSQPSCTDGGYPDSSLTFDSNGNLYGTTYYGGANGYGAVYELSPNGEGGWTEQVIYSFCSVGGEHCTDGKHPFLSYVMFDGAGNLYGTATAGGANGYGVVFELSPGPGESWTETVLYSFAGGANGAYPSNGLIMDPKGNFYGSTLEGGSGSCSGGCGTVFELSPGSGWTEQVIYNVDNKGYYVLPGSDIIPSGNSGLAMNANGNIFGAVGLTVFELSSNGNGGWTPTLIYTFPGAAYYCLTGTPVLDNAGNIYGTLERFNRRGSQSGPGKIYKLSPGKNGKWKPQTLTLFQNGDGANSGEAVVLDAAGNVYGTTLGGGEMNQGTVFELVAPVGKGSYKEKVLWSFNWTDGGSPYAGPILDRAGNLYGTTNVGGFGGGAVFEVTP